jgi:hypothetical protein
MERADIVLRNSTYAMFVELGRAPTASDVAERLGLTGPFWQLAR